MTISIENALERLIHARSNRCPVAPLSETHGDLTLEHGYAIQDRLGAKLNDGKRRIGWKLAATSSTGQAIMGVKEPASGFLLPVQYVSGTELSASEYFLQKTKRPDETVRPRVQRARRCLETRVRPRCDRG